MNCAEAIQSATAEVMRERDDVVILGLGVHDKNAVFGTCAGLLEEFGPERVIECPNAEAMYSGLAHGMALAGKRPIVIFQRNEFALYAMSQIVNHAAPWRFMTGTPLPITYRMVIGKGWGNGPQHSGAYHSMFCNVPDLEVFMPGWPTNAAWLTRRAILLDKPTIIFECKSMYGSTWDPEEAERKIRNPRPGYFLPETPNEALDHKPSFDYGIVAVGDMIQEAVKAGEYIAKMGKSVAVHSITILKPMDVKDISVSIRGAHTVVVADVGNPRCSFASEVIASLAIHGMKSSFRRVTRPDAHTPAAAHLELEHYPDWTDIVAALGFERPSVIRVTSEPKDVI